MTHLRASISFLERRVQPHFRVFEYGSGMSTMWWATRVAQVVACEDDALWAGIVEDQTAASGNVDVLRREGDAYFDAARETGTFHVVTIDGSEPRNRCVEAAVAALEPDGVIVWDNTDRPEYRPGLDQLAMAGFRRVEFDGLTPLNNEILQTTVLYRDGNCLGL